MKLMGSKEDSLQSTLNKGDPKWGWCQTIFCEVVSRDTVVVAQEGKCLMVISILESLKA